MMRHPKHHMHIVCFIFMWEPRAIDHCVSLGRWKYALNAVTAANCTLTSLSQLYCTHVNVI